MRCYKKILVVCPANTVTGGPEALHQLAAHMIALGLPAYMVYMPFNEFFEPPTVYQKYKVPVATFVDERGTLVVFPEVYPMQALAIKNADAALWWLSLENFLERRHISWFRDKLRYYKRVIKGERPLLGARSLKNLIHFSQTEHSTQYLRSCGIEPVPLIDSINEDFLTDKFLGKTSHKKNIILYNPSKGKKVTAALIKDNPQWDFLPLQGLKPRELSERLYEAKLYIDFGHHPGRDRMPREAAMHGCCLITGILGSAGNEVDLPIPTKYKLDALKPNFLSSFKLLAEDIFNNFDLHSGNLKTYRAWLKNEPLVFKRQIADYFLCDAPAADKIFSVTHKSNVPALPGGYDYISVGSARVGEYSDSTGDNIGHLNPFFCELTAIYWIWKNYRVDDDAMIGLTHYRRFFTSEKTLDILLKRYLTCSEAKSLLNEYDLILPQQTLIADGMYQHYKGSHQISDFDLMMKILVEECGLDQKSLEKFVFQSKKMFLFNMFITKKMVLKSYCEWAFPILFKIFEMNDMSSRDAYQQRAIGFLAERLFNIWIWANPNLKVKELPVIYMHKTGFSNLNRYRKDLALGKYDV